MKTTLAEALLRRKELQLKVDVLRDIDKGKLYEVKARRQQVSDSVEDIVLQVPKLSAGQVTAELDWHAMQLRRVDAAIQRANWETQVVLDDDTMLTYSQACEKAG